MTEQNTKLLKQGAIVGGIQLDSKTFVIRLLPIVSQLAMELILTGKVNMKGKDGVPATLVKQFLAALIEEIDNG